MPVSRQSAVDWRPPATRHRRARKRARPADAGRPSQANEEGSRRSTEAAPIGVIAAKTARDCSFRTATPSKRTQSCCAGLPLTPALDPGFRRFDAADWRKDRMEGLSIGDMGGWIVAGQSPALPHRPSRRRRAAIACRSAIRIGRCRGTLADFAETLCACRLSQSIEQMHSREPAHRKDVNRFKILTLLCGGPSTDGVI